MIGRIETARTKKMTTTEAPATDTPTFKKPVCPSCGGEQILRDAWAEWSATEGTWVLKSIFDSFYCENCDSEISTPNWAALGKTQIIQIQNDRFRRGDATIPGRRMITSGIQELAASAGKSVTDVMDEVAAFDTFTADSDPYHEHDFGSFDFEGQTCFWKLDYYNATLDGGSEDPSDLTQTQRVLTIMLSHEY
jgi:predicted RNA-binding Zn-ribbon protein involved in translation (DUF1610 family)